MKLKSLLNDLKQIEDSFFQLANNAGDVPEWNKKGHAYKASRKIKKLITKLENTKNFTDI